MKFRQRIERFMYGRYGADKFGNAIIWTSLAIMIVNSFINSLILYLIEVFLIGYCFFRMLSRNINNRYKENQKFEAVWNKVKNFFKLRKSMWKDRKTHVFTKCPHCKINLRLPKKRGKHTVKCPKCQRSFEFKCR